jgi:hypothetical protein
MRGRVTATVLTALLLTVTTAGAGNYAPGSFAQQLRIDWQVSGGAGGPVVEGWVYNFYGLPADRMRLSIDLLDGSGNVIGQTTTWVAGGVPANNRSWFSTRVPPAAAYRVEILSFDWVGRGQ